MSKLQFATKADDKDLRDLLSQNPMDSWVNISLEREPSYFDGVSLMGETYTLVSKEDSNLVGMYSCTYMEVHLNGSCERLGYLGELRVHKSYRNKIRFIKEGFESLKILTKKSSKEFYFTSLATQNKKARRLLEADIKALPKYEKRGQMSTLVFSNRIYKKHRFLKKATTYDIDEIVSFYNTYASQFNLSPFMAKEWLEGLDSKKGLSIDDFYIARDSNNEIISCAALWDQRDFKQSVIKSYKSPLKYLRVLYNLYAYMSKRVLLPKENERLESLFISFFAYKDEAVAIKTLEELSYLSKSIDRINSCILGISSHSNILCSIKKHFRPSIYLTEIESVSFAKELSNIFDERPVQPEVALL